MKNSKKQRGQRVTFEGGFVGEYSPAETMPLIFEKIALKKTKTQLTN
jgi:hypothetical protein